MIGRTSELDFRKIVKARKLASKTRSIRCFQSPKIYFQVTGYIEVIDLNTIAITQPLLLRRVSDDEIWAKIIAGEIFYGWNFGKFLCQTQAFEHCVKLVTEVCKNRHPQEPKRFHKIHSCIKSFDAKVCQEVQLLFTDSKTVNDF